MPGTTSTPRARDEPGVDPMTTVGLLFEAAAGLRRSLAPTLEHELGVAGQSFEILIRLHRSPGGELRMSDLAAQTRITPSGLTRAIDRLEGAGLVEREACTSDRRGAFARLTADGRRRTGEAVREHRHDIEIVFDTLFGPGEEALLAELLRRVRDRVNPTAAQLSSPGADGVRGAAGPSETKTGPSDR